MQQHQQIKRKLTSATSLPTPSAPKRVSTHLSGRRSSLVSMPFTWIQCPFVRPLWCNMSLIFVLLLLLDGAQGAFRAEDVIQQLNEDLKLQLNIYLNCGDVIELLPRMDMPKVILETKAEDPLPRILGRYSERSLTIACLADNQTLSGIVQLLWGLQHLPILFLLSNPKEFAFERALSQGFLHVLALNLRSGELYTYLPYPTVQIQRLESISEYHRLTQLKNLQRHAVHITVETMAPRCFHYTDRSGRNVYAGYMYKLLHEFVRVHNGTEVAVLQDMDPIPLDTGLFMFKRGVIDMAPRIIHPLGWVAYYRSHVLFNVNGYIMVPWAEPLPKSLYIVRPFESSVWAVLIGYLLLATIIIRCMRDRTSSLAAIFLQVLQMLLQQSLSTMWHYTQGLRHVLVFLALFTVGFILSTMYQAQLSSSVTTGLYKRQINSFDDLAHTDLKMMMENFDIEFLMNHTKSGVIQPELLNIVLNKSLDEVFYHRKHLNTSYIYQAIEDRLRFELFQQRYLRVPLFKQLPEVFYQVPFFVGMRHGLPYASLFNVYLRRIWESGILLKWEGDAYFEGIFSGEISFHTSTGLQIQVFDMEFYYCTYILLALGWIVSGIVFAIERLVCGRQAAGGIC
ncbi:uncharacterized protein LOC117893351 [Drosophila subobscura]|uniref:uncharacterized protein LOC117893351 n=1 Tax=Drosophila subobscura TaxID=7241 RepID=UPI00155AD640|nr:uncharacterized protein LOC117893351 [Drosophila subobscura]